MGSFNVTLRSVATHRVETRPRMFPVSDMIIWDELKALQARGHEITSHGLRHIDYVDATNIELWAEMKVSQAIFASRGIYVKVFTCPFNQSNDRIEELSDRFYPYHRGRTGVNKIPVKGRIYHCLSWPDALRSITDNVWAVGAWHDVVDLHKFRKAINYVKQVGATVVTVEEMMKT